MGGMEWREYGLEYGIWMECNGILIDIDIGWIICIFVNYYCIYIYMF
jgi:hypothetical protein